MEYPVWVYHSDQPLQFDLCKSAVSWNRYRRNKWRLVEPATVATRLRKFVEAAQIDLAEFASITRERGSWLSHHEISVMYHGMGDPHMYTMDRLEELANTWHLPVTYFYTGKVYVAINIFRPGHKASHKSVYSPDNLMESVEVTHDADLASKIEEGPDLRMFHVLFSLPGSPGFSRAHVLALDTKSASRFVEKRHPDAVIKEISSQPAVPGLYLETL